MTVHNTTSCFAAGIAGVSAEALVSASMGQLVLASVIGALVLHLVILPLVRLLMRVFMPVCFVVTVVVFFISLVYMQQHTRPPLERYDWVTDFDSGVSEFMNAMFMWKS